MNTDELNQLKLGLDPHRIVAQYCGGPAGKKMVRCPSLSHGEQSGKTPPCSIDYAAGLFNCFGCGAAGSMLDLVGYASIAGYNPKHDIWRAAELLSPGSRSSVPVRQTASARVVKPPEFSRSRCEEWTERLVKNQRLVDWLEDRGCLKWREYNFGYTENDTSLKHWARRRITIPHIHQEQVWAVKLRLSPFIPQDSTKYLSLEGSRYHIPYSADCLLHPIKRLVVVETEMDACAVDSTSDISAIAFPAGLSTKNAAAFLSGMVFAEKITLIPDNDDAGRELARVLAGYVPRLDVFWLPEEYKDIGEYIAINGTPPGALLRDLRTST